MKGKIMALTIFALALAFVEAVVVVYLHQVLPIEELRKLSQPPPPAILTLPFIAFLKNPGALFPDTRLLIIEQTREVATLIVLGTMAWVWGKTYAHRILAFIFSFST